MRRFLKYEMDRYLNGRSAERKKELPLERVENQGYIHYSKASVVFYALQDYVGEDKVSKPFTSTSSAGSVSKSSVHLLGGAHRSPSQDCAA